MRRAGWPPVRLGGTMDTGTDIAAAERLDVSREALKRVRSRAGAVGPIIANLNEIASAAVAA